VSAAGRPQWASNAYPLLDVNCGLVVFVAAVTAIPGARYYSQCRSPIQSYSDLPLPVALCFMSHCHKSRVFDNGVEKIV
jgi:hypothetical protein